MLVFCKLLDPLGLRAKYNIYLSEDLLHLLQMPLNCDITDKIMESV